MILRFIVNGEIEHEDRTNENIPQEMMPILKGLRSLHIAELVLDKDELNEMEGADLKEDIVLKDVVVNGSLTEFGEPVFDIDVTKFVEND